MRIQNYIKNRRAVNGALANHICNGSGRLQINSSHNTFILTSNQTRLSESCTKGEELTKHCSFFPNIEIGLSFIHRYPFLIHTTLTLPNSVVILTGFLIAINIKIPVDHL